MILISCAMILISCAAQFDKVKRSIQGNMFEKFSIRSVGSVEISVQLFQTKERTKQRKNKTKKQRNKEQQHISNLFRITCVV